MRVIKRYHFTFFNLSNTINEYQCKKRKGIGKHSDRNVYYNRLRAAPTTGSVIYFSIPHICVSHLPHRVAKLGIPLKEKEWIRILSLIIRILY